MALSWIFFSEEMRHALQEQEREYFENQLVPSAMTWDDKIKFADALCIKAESFKPDLLFDTPAVDPKETHLSSKKTVTSPCGKFVYCNRILPRGHGLTISQGRRKGRVYFDGDVIVPVLAEVEEHNVHPKVWMSITPGEIFTQRAGLRKADGRVVVVGLGLGYLLRNVCARKNVTEVVLVERDGHLIDWIGPLLRSRYPELRKVSEWIAGDGLEYARNFVQKNTVYLFDIWTHYGYAAEDLAFQELKKELPRIWGWGDYA